MSMHVGCHLQMRDAASDFWHEHIVPGLKEISSWWDSKRKLLRSLVSQHQPGDQPARAVLARLEDVHNKALQPVKAVGHWYWEDESKFIWSEECAI
jgi:hypothetical protein